MRWQGARNLAQTTAPSQFRQPPDMVRDIFSPCCVQQSLSSGLSLDGLQLRSPISIKRDDFTHLVFQTMSAGKYSYLFTLL